MHHLLARATGKGIAGYNRLALLLPALAVWGLSGCATQGAGRDDVGPVLRPVAAVVTEPAGSEGDAADDAAVYVHPYAPERSLILGTDKKGGLLVFDLAGRRLQTASPSSRPNNVDVLYAVPDGRGGRMDLAVAGAREAGRLGLRYWRIDPFTRQLADVTRGGHDVVLEGDEPYGSCVYRSAIDARRYVFVNSKSGRVEQRELVVHDDGTVSSVLRRVLGLPSQVEGMVADDERGWLFVAEEAVGLWRFPAEPDGGTAGVLVAKVGEHGLTADVEGVSIYRGAGGSGFLVVSSQGSSDFKVYDRRPPHRFLATIRPRGTPDAPAPRETDGVVAESAPLGRRFPRGVLVVQDGAEPPRLQDFKVYDWADIASGLPRVAPAPSPRLRPQRVVAATGGN
ncbi:MAG: phytase [Tepidisphaerales bacterium]